MQVDALRQGEARFALVFEEPLLVLCASFGEALPWMAVLIANDRPPKKAMKVNRFGGHPDRSRAIAPAASDSRVIEG